MYAVIQTGGKQYRVSPGDVCRVEKIAAEPGETIELDQVLMVADGSDVSIGKPTVAGTKVLARVVSHEKGRKVIVFRYKPKVRFRRKTGHRQWQTLLSITSIVKN